MITNIQIPYSWFNISLLIGYNTITFQFPTGSTTYSSFVITIPDGLYTTTTAANYYFQSLFVYLLYIF